jgi:ribonuclease D
LAEVLSGPATLLAHAADQDLEVLAHACDAEPSRLFDTQLAAGFLGMSSPSLTSLAENLLGIRLPKGDRLTDWSKRPLTESQLSYAASDVAHLHDLADVIRGRLTEAGRLAWAEQECANLLARARGPQDPDTAWWRLREGRTLRGQARGVAQAVVAWRERRAMELDIPPRFVLPDLAVLSIAHRPPSDAAGLDGVRGVEGRHLKARAVKDLLAAIETGQQLDGTALRLPVVEDVDRDQRPAVALAAAWIAQLGRELAIDPALLATRADIVALLRGDEGARAAMGWRADVVGDPVRRLARGDAALAFDGRGGLVLEERSRRPITAF